MEARAAIGSDGTDDRRSPSSASINPEALDTIEILGVPIGCFLPMQALERVEELYLREDPAVVAHVNTHTLNLAFDDPDYRDVLRRADLVLNDGKGVMLAARIQGRRFPSDLHGNYFSPLLLRRAAERGWRVFFLGAASGVAERAADRLTSAIPRLNIVGTRDGFFTTDEEAIQSIRSTSAEIVLVGMGNPLQEQWLDRCLPETGARLGVGVGAFFDFVAGAVPRAPAWMSRRGLEWVHRLAQDPKRMWRRYVFGNPQFVYRNVRVRFGGQRNLK